MVPKWLEESADLHHSKKQKLKSSLQCILVSEASHACNPEILLFIFYKPYSRHKQSQNFLMKMKSYE